MAGVTLSAPMAAASPLRRLLARPGSCLALAVLVGAGLMALLAPLVAPHDPNAFNLGDRLLPPWLFGGKAAYPMGTDQIGKDVLSRVIYGARLSLLFGLLAVAISAALGVVLGLAAGYFRGAVEAAVMRIADVQLAFPFILLAITIIGILGATVPNVVAVLALSGWVQFARVVRAEVLSLDGRPFVDSARAVGASHTRILFLHLAPNIMPSVIVMATLELGRVIILESGLTFLGLGIPPPAVTWGAMLAEGRNYVREAWWLTVFPGLALMLVVLAINVAGDALRDVLDPATRGRT